MTNRSIAILAALLIASPAAAGVKEGVEKWQAGDHKGAVVEWLPYAAKGDPDALFNLGQAYKLGRGVPMDKAKAEDFYRRAADKGHAPAQSNLGIVLAQRGAKPEAAKLWQQAAAKGEPRAQYMLGVLHFNGDTVEKNWPLAYAYMLKANEAGLPQAARAMTTMGSNLAEADRTRGKELAAAMGSANRLATSGKPVTTSQRVAGDAPAPVAVKAKLPEPMTPIRAASPAKASPRPIVAAATVPQPAHGASDGGWRVQLVAGQKG